MNRIWLLLPICFVLGCESSQRKTGDAGEPATPVSLFNQNIIRGSGLISSSKYDDGDQILECMCLILDPSQSSERRFMIKNIRQIFGNEIPVEKLDLILVVDYKAELIEGADNPPAVNVLDLSISVIHTMSNGEMTSFVCDKPISSKEFIEKAKTFIGK